MTLKDQLMADLKEALRSGDTIRKSEIRMVRAAIANAEIAWQREASDQDVLQIISHEIKQRRESIEMFQRGGREDLVAEEKAKLQILQEYMPQQLSREEIVEVLQRIIAETGPGQFGPVMNRAMAELKGRADGRLVNQLTREMLSS